ncbi:hypothetical protein BGZ51_009757 [Haplosporangium sp. Z 767]|nr:hypothetical protein BGZ51_009757 [Haplosporangium sp. Z 767]
MASGFFRSIPDAILVKDPYEEVFSLFTTETADSPWAHNRSVSQQSTRLEVELDFTPAPSPSVSQPGSRPDSRSGSYFSGLNADPGSLSSSPSPSPSSLTTADIDEETKGETGGMVYEPNLSAVTSTSSIPKVKSPAARALLGSRKSSRAGSGSGLTKGPTSQAKKKPVVIHQSLSTLSQPGQTGTVVWDSSILMAKFMLSIKGLTTGCYRYQVRERREQRAMGTQTRKAQQVRIRRLEEQAERIAVSEEGELKMKDGEDDVGGLPIQDAEDTMDEVTPDEDDERSGDNDDEDKSDESEDDDNTENEDMLVFDPAETSILELGSGCGLLGIVMAELCQDLLLTDQEAVLPLLVKNLRKNLDKKYFDLESSFSGSSTNHATSTTASTKGSRKVKERSHASGTNDNVDAIRPCHIQVQELIWGQDLDQELKRGFGIDYIVATDVVYNESIVPKLVQTLKELSEVRERVRQEIRQGRGEHFERPQAMDAAEGTNRKMRRMMNRTVFLLAQELRTDYVHLSFLEKLKDAGFRVVRMPKQLMDEDFRSGYAIYACFLHG